MGVHVHLYVDYGHVDDAQWSGVCEEVLRLIEAYPESLLVKMAQG